MVGTATDSTGESLRTALQDLAFPTLRKSLSDEVLDQLRAAIIRGHLKPGQRLNETALATTFDVSRGPVREALTQLAREGLVSIHRHRGATVARLSREEIEEIYELRVALERLAMERAVRLATEEDLAAMESVIEALQQPAQDGEMHEVLDLDMKLHDLIYRAAQHSRLYACWSNLRSQIHAFLFSRTTAANENYLKLVVSEHAALLEPIKARDKDRAVRLIEGHLRDAYERMTQQPFENEE
jgi:DNA-binding GntR family transcriptional regulator